MAITPLLFVKVELQETRVPGTEPMKLPVLSHSEGVSKDILESFQGHAYDLARFLSFMKLKKVTFTASRELLQPATVAKVCRAMKSFAEAGNKKKITAQIASQEDCPILKDVSQELADTAAEECAQAERAFIAACTEITVEMS